ncbi:hypothetical protein FRC10_004699, partial [Ceratobasidium sp. 414]
RRGRGRALQADSESQITDVEIAFRESVFTRSAGSQLLNHIPYAGPTADVRSSFTPTLGLQIAPKAHPRFEGTGSLYLREGGERNRVLLLTARHIVLPPREYRNELYVRKANNSARREVILLGCKAYQNVLRSMMDKIGCEALMAEYYKNELEDIGEAVEGEGATIADTREEFRGKLAKAEKVMGTLSEFHREITMLWTDENQRVLGHIIHAPPISVSTGDKDFTEDWALVELDDDKIDWQNFKGNVIDLGTRLSPGDFVVKMHPDRRSLTSFEYPRGGLLQLRGVVKEDELRHPTMLDKNGEECIIVVKNGNTTGVTFAIYPYGHKGGAFSAPGDSGSVIADANSRILGILIGGAGRADYTDVTYASPYYWVEERIKEAFPDSYLYPITA